MNLVMTSAPIAMVGCGHSVTNSTLGIQWHVLGMYAPSFITGHLIVRFGLFRIIALGLSLLLVSAAISLAGQSIAHFWIGLALLGVGWNFAFIGATTLVTRCHRPEERNKVQSLNDFLIFGTMALGSFASGKMLATLGWAFVNATVFPPVLAVGALLAWMALGSAARWPEELGFPGIWADAAISGVASVAGFLAYPRHIQPGGACLACPAIKLRIS